MPTTPDELFAYLDRLGIAHTTVRHQPLFTVEESQSLPATGPSFRDATGGARANPGMWRELLLAQSSDWAFQIFQGTTVEYSSRRFQSHIHRFNLLAEMLDAGELTEHQLALIAEIENRDTIFQEID